MPIFPSIIQNGVTLKGPAADGTNGQVMVTDGNKNLSFDDKIEQITGTYTGDGSTGQAIAIGFNVPTRVPRYVKVWQQVTSDGDEAKIYETTPDILDDSPSGGAIDAKDAKFNENRIIAFGADSFTVDDNGGDEHPNQSGAIYNFVAEG